MRNQFDSTAPRHSLPAMLKCVAVLAIVLSSTVGHAQMIRTATSPVQAYSDSLLGIGSSGLSSLSSELAGTDSTTGSGQPDLPTTISPLRIEPDPNNVNLINGKTQMNIPVLAVPGAPNLRYDRAPNSAPHIVGKLNDGFDSTLQSSYTVSRIDGSSDSFTCVDYDCTDVTGSGSVLIESTQNASRYTRGGTGEAYRFDLKHADVTVQNSTTSTTRTTIYYASSVTFQNGEVLTYTYDTALDISVGITRTYYRPTRISSNLGFYIAISYHAATLGQAGWGSPATAAIYNASDPSTPLKRLDYSLDGTVITEVTTSGNRTYTCVQCRNSLGTDIEVTSGSETYPGESTPARSVTGLSLGLSDGLVGSVNNDGVVWTYTYLNPRDKVAPGSNNKNVIYDRVTVTGPNNYNVMYDMTLSYSFDRNLMTKMTDSLGRATILGYDTFFRLVRIVDPEGIETTIAYDLVGNITSKTTKPKPGSALTPITETLGFTAPLCDGSTFEIACYRPNWHRDGLGRQTDFVYNSRGQLTERTDPADADGVRKRTIITWDATSGISRMTAVQVCGGTAQACNTANEIRTNYTYWGNTLLPTTVTQIDAARGESLVTTNTYDLAGRLKVSDGPLAGTADATYYHYDQFGRQTWQIGPADSSGRRQATLKTYRNSDDKVTAVETGYVTSVTTPVLMALTRTETEYDDRRNPRVERVLNAGTPYTLTQRTFDNRGRLTCEARRMNSAAFSSLPSDACTLGATGSFGEDRITRNIYDNGSQLLQVQRAVGTSIQQNYATYTYTTNGKQRTVSDSNGNLTTYEYDGFDRMSKMIFPSATLGAGVSNASDYEQYGYDTVGNRTSLRKRDGNVITYSYDALNRVRSKAVPASTTGAAGYSVFYGYDVRGLQTFARFGSTTGIGVTNVYDGFGWLRSSSTDMDGTSRSVTYAYDPHGNRTRITHPDGNYFEYAYEANDNPRFVYENGPGAEVMSYLSDAFGRRERIERNSGVGSITAILFDEISRLRSIGHNFDGTSTGNDVSIGFSYNPASQVVARAQTNGIYDYPIPAANSVYTSNGRNQITQIAGTNGGTLAWDANGNLTSDGFTTFGYDTENRLVGASGAKTATLTYDPMGRLYHVSDAVGAQRFLYDGDRLILEYNGSGVVQRRYAHGANVDEPIVWHEGSAVSGATRRYLHADHQGSIINVTDAAGSTLLVGAYDAYGVTTSNVGRFQYTGQTAIQQVGLYYYKARFYNPSLGRFMQTDPIGYDDDVNLYAYVGNDPLNKTDPTGNCPTCFKIAGDFALDAAVQYLSTGEVDWGAAATSAVVNAFNPAGTFQKIGKIAKIVKSEKTFTRYMGKGEAEIAKKTGQIPNVGRDGQPRPTHGTTDAPTNSASEAQTKYELPEPPTHRATVPQDRVQDIGPAPDGRATTSGGGSQSATSKPIPVKSCEIVELCK